jgi:hypothetical protein
MEEERREGRARVRWPRGSPLGGLPVIQAMMTRASVPTPKSVEYLFATLHDELKLGRLQVRGKDLDSVAGPGLATEERTRLVANGGTKSRLWWMCAEGLARKP